MAGSHGHSLIHKAFLGSISEQILKNSPIPVLIIPTKK
ncbi:MAG: universal stress protein [Lentisphaeria bacterium]